MNLLTQRALRVFAVLEDYRAGSVDILDALLPFFEPFLADRSGQLLDTAELAQAVSQAYRWSLTSDIIEELTARFEARGWVIQLESTNDAALYRIVCEGRGEGTGRPAVAQVNEALDQIAELFQKFIVDLSPLTTVARTKDELSEVLVQWLVSIDADVSPENSSRNG